MSDHATDRPPNRLAKSASPYLLQHAHNPVDWYEWGDEAFAEARGRDVPIFLSIGYSSCYWCHVMERECFESDQIAALMNERFVCVKVDREERPDVDEIYMAATVTMTGHGGWPMSVFLEPSKLRPFWCGTYLPPRPNPSLGSMSAFPQILEGMADAWRDQRDDVLRQAEQVAGAVREQLGIASTPVEIGQSQVQHAISGLLRSLDLTNGGFGGAPKFPQPVFLEFLFEARGAAADDPTRSAIDHALRLTLDQMALGGIFDHVGGGFHRYAVDATWTVPHFEKMLYDNAQLASAYARAASVYDDEFYKTVACRTLDYVLREMTSPDGEFFCAQDAEVDGREGLNYIWSADEVSAALGDDADAAVGFFGLDASPNFRDPHHPSDEPRFVLRLAQRPDDSGVYRRVCDRLYQIRCSRTQPRLDDKVLASWNGLMIAAFAFASQQLGEPKYHDAAIRAASFVLDTMRTDDGDLVRSWRDGTPGPPGQLEDYAFFVHGLLALHSVDNARRWLDAANDLIGRAESLFGDGAGGFFDTATGRTDLFVRARSTHDGAVPSASSVMLDNLIRLGGLSGDTKRANDALASLSAAIAENPVGSAYATRGLLRLLRDGRIAPGASAQPKRDDHFTPVEIYADTERITVTDDQPSVINLVMRIADGYHVVAAEQPEGAPDLQPLRVGLIPGSGSGVAVFGDYPKSEPYGADGELNAHLGEIEFVLLVERRGEWSGRPMLGVTFQACTDTECLAPTTVTLDVALDRG